MRLVINKIIKMQLGDRLAYLYTRLACKMRLGLIYYNNAATCHAANCRTARLHAARDHPTIVTVTNSLAYYNSV
jgi:hypothetical protein